MTKGVYKSNEKRASHKLELIHSDVCQVDAPSLSGARYFLTFIEDFSRLIFVYFLKTKDEVPRNLQHFINFVHNQTNLRIKTFRSDNGKDFVNSTAQQILNDAGIKHETSITYTPEQNGRAERANRTLLDKARCMLQESDLEKRFWAEAIATAAYVANRSPKQSLQGRTPEELWSGKKPNLFNLKVFGCPAYAHVPTQLRQKMNPKAKPCTFLGYCANQKGYSL